jgi:hypothetical protein
MELKQWSYPSILNECTWMAMPFQEKRFANYVKVNSDPMARPDAGGKLR